MFQAALKSLARKALTAEAMILLGAYASAVRWGSVRRLLQRHHRLPSSATNEGSMDGALAVRGAIRSATARWPFHVSCLAQSLAAADMLRRTGLPYTLKIGASIREAEPFGAHAWVESSGITVAGEGDNSFFSVLLRLPERTEQG